MLKVALTGSIAMGKSTTARMFADLGCPVFDADATVHALYDKGGAAVPVISAMYPAAVRNGKVDRQALADIVLNDSDALQRLEAAVHPLVRRQQIEFVEAAAKAGYTFVILDIPLLFETGGEKNVDRVVVVSAPAELQRTRALERPGMTEKKLAEILARQVPDAEKRARADFIVDTGKGIEDAFDQVRQIIEDLTADSHPGT